MPDTRARRKARKAANDEQPEQKSWKSNAESINDKIAKMLLEMADYENTVTRERFKYVAYRKAAGVIARHPSPIRSGKDAKKLEGIGQGIASRIDEILKTGKMETLEEAKDDETANAIQELTKINGIGPAYAHQLYDQGIRSIDDLRKDPEKLNEQQQLGLKHYDDFEQKIPRDEIKLMEDHIQRVTKGLDDNFVATVCGSYRRGAESSWDLDIVLTHPSFTSRNLDREARSSRSSRSRSRSPDRGRSTDRSRSRSNVRNRSRSRSRSLTRGQSEQTGLLGRIVNALKQTGFITDTFSEGGSKFTGACALNNKILAQVKSIEQPASPRKFINRRINIRLIPQDQYWCGVLYMTGSADFNRRIRLEAERKGCVLSEYGLRKLDANGKESSPIPMNSEKDIFEHLDMDYVKPEDRSELTYD